MEISDGKETNKFNKVGQSEDEPEKLEYSEIWLSLV